MSRRAMENENEVVAILNTARRLINEGNPIMALQAVVSALRLAGGEREVGPALKRAHDQCQRHARASAEANDLSALFAECAIAEVSNTISHSESQQQQQQQQVSSVLGAGAAAECSEGMEYVMEEEEQQQQVPVPILAESGRMQVVVDASADGSSFVCHRCGGVMSSARRDEHMLVWCSQAPASNNSGGSSN